MEQESTDRPESEPSILADARARFREANNRNRQQWAANAEEEYAFAAGKQWAFDDLQHYEDQNRIAVTFNRVLAILKAVAGHEVSNRQEVRYIPREMGDVGVNELLTGAADWVRDQCDAEDEESDSFYDALVCGIGVTRTHMDWEGDPEGRVVIERVDPLSVWWDPSAKKRNLTDSRYAFYLQRHIPLEDAQAMFPDAHLTGGGAAAWGIRDDTTNAVSRDVAEDEYAAKDESHGIDIRGGVDLLEHQWMQSDPALYVLNPLSGQVETVPEESVERALFGAVIMGAVSQEQAPTLIRGKTTVKRCYRAVFCGDEILSYGPNADPERLTLNCITGDRDRNDGTWFGLVRPLKDPQKWANKFYSEMLHIIQTNSKGGLIAEADAFDNPSKVEAEWARPDGIVWAKDNAVAERRFVEKPRSEVPASMTQMMVFALDSMRDVTGVNVHMLGAAETQQSGVLEFQRRQAGLTILATMFDSLRRYRKNQGRVLLTFIQQYISDDRLIRVVGRDGKAEYVPLAKDRTSGTYDVIVDEAPSSPNQKERTFSLLTALFPPAAWGTLPPPMILELLRYSPLPESLVNRLGELQQEMGQDPAQAAAQQLAMQQAQADVEKTQSETVENQADAFLKRTKAMAEGVTVPARVLQMAREPRAAR